jgi:acetylornithine aminotransferase
VKAIDDELLANVRERGAELESALGRLPGVLGVRGRGVLLGIEVERDAGELVDAARADGLLVLTAGERVVRLAPPLTVSAADVAEAISILNRILC